jgi:hypothetical protein
MISGCLDVALPRNGRSLWGVNPKRAGERTALAF